MVRIMVIEDEKIATQDILEKIQMIGQETCCSYSSAEEAIANISKENPDLILMDIVLSGKMDGITAAEEIRKTYQIPVIFLTAHSEDAILKRAVHTRPFGYLLKPLSEKDLKTAIEMALYNKEIEIRLIEREKELNARIKELEKLNKMMVDRELKMLEMKKEIEKLKGEK